MPDIAICPGNSALLIQNMQNDIVKSDRPVVPMGSAVLIANCQKLLVRARQVSMPVLYVQVIRRQDGKDAPRPPFGTAAAAGGPALVDGTLGAQVVSELAPQPEDPLVTKHTTLRLTPESISGLAPTEISLTPSLSTITPVPRH